MQNKAEAASSWGLAELGNKAAIFLFTFYDKQDPYIMFLLLKVILSSVEFSTRKNVILLVGSF